MCYYSTQYNNPISVEIDYYGVLFDVIQLQYFGNLQVGLFNCLWYNVLSEGNGLKVDEYGFNCVKNINFLNTYEPFILASQVKQVFYLNDKIDPSWSTVLTIEVCKQFILNGQMSGASVYLYQEGRMGYEHLTSDIDVNEIF